MSLTLVATPIGNYGDMTLRGIETLREADLIICEEIKPAQILLKRLKIEGKTLLQLNEHSTKADLIELAKNCSSQKVALISDCGTPGFYDPGAELVEICVKQGIEVDANPGVSSLMNLISLSGIKLKEFYFVGFLPAENSQREAKLKEISKMSVPLVFMDTPYRLNKLIGELKPFFGERFAVLGMDLSSAEQQIHRDKLSNLKTDYPKSPFVLILS